MSCMKDGFVPGSLLDGRFEAVAPLNHGSFGMVFLARDTTSGDMVAIKCLLKNTDAQAQPNLTSSDHLIELNSHDRLGSHRNIVNLISAFESDAHLYLVLEYCSMGDLYEAIRLGRGPLETQHVRAFMLELLGAVEYSHAKGLYHRDIKPENIFLTSDGTMKLGDFGLATTETWSFEPCVGSDRYMAPEQYEPADVGYSPAHADIWAIGICLLNVLFSRNPFITPSESDVLFADFVRDRQSLFDVFPSMSQDTYEVLSHALALDPSKRSLAAVRAALERAITFTTDDDLFDDFCTEDRAVVHASANRQPLRTPSIQSPPIEQGGAFPWAKALHLSPTDAVRQLSAIPDSELETDELFPEKGPAAWCTPVPETPSIASVIDSALGASIQSMTLKDPKPRNGAAKLSESVPISAPKLPRAMSMVFSKDAFSKSWSDLWDEDFEAEEEEQQDARRRFNDRNWSTESLDQHANDTSGEDASPSRPMHAFLFGSDGSDQREPSIFDSAPHSAKPQLPVYSPPAKRSVLDKWAALGSRRRAVNVEPMAPKSGSTAPTTPAKGMFSGARRRGEVANAGWRSGFGFGSITAFSGSAKVRSSSTGSVQAAQLAVDAERKSRAARNANRDSGIAMQVSDWRKDAAPLAAWQHMADTAHSNGVAVFDDGADAEWVGGWRDLHL